MIPIPDVILLAHNIDQVAYPDGVTPAEVLDGLATVHNADGAVAWKGRIEDPRGGH